MVQFRVKRSASVLIVIGGVVGTVVAARRCFWKKRKSKDDLKAIVWNAIHGTMAASQLYLGDRMGFYVLLQSLDWISIREMASRAGVDPRFLREWAAQQSALGVLEMRENTIEQSIEKKLEIRLVAGMGEILADPNSEHYEISLIEMMPSLMERARSVLPNAFRSGVGVGYNDRDITNAIDRAHRKHIRRVLIPRVIPSSSIAKKVLLEHAEKKTQSIRIAELGCGGGNLLIALATQFPHASFHGFEISEVALQLCQERIQVSKLENVFIHDARLEPLGAHCDTFDLAFTYDVLHDAPDPSDLISQVHRALKPQGAFIIGDIAALDSVSNNVKNHPAAATLYGISTCLCLASALSAKGTDASTEGLGTLGWTVPTAFSALNSAGFSRVRLLLEVENMRWVEASSLNA